MYLLKHKPQTASSVLLKVKSKNDFHFKSGPMRRQENIKRSKVGYNGRTNGSIVFEYVVITYQSQIVTS